MGFFEVGVTTEPISCLGLAERTVYLFGSEGEYKGLSYSFNGCKGFIIQNRDGKDKVKKKGLGRWKKNQIVTVELDRKKWEITFHKDDKCLGPVKIETGQNYYPAISVAAISSHDYQDYKLLLD